MAKLFTPVYKPGASVATSIDLNDIQFWEIKWVQFVQTFMNYDYERRSLDTLLRASVATLLPEKYGLIMFLRFPTMPINVKQGPHCEKFPQNGVFDDFFTNWWKMLASISRVHIQSRAYVAYVFNFDEMLQCSKSSFQFSPPPSSDRPQNIQQTNCRIHILNFSSVAYCHKNVAASATLTNKLGTNG